ncbi:MAG: aminodeoxychorismate lyase [Gallionella sp.]
MLVNGKQGDLISIRDRGLLYGDGIFRSLRVQQGKPLHWPLHYQKLRHDCLVMGIACPDFNLLSDELDGLLLNHHDGVAKLIVTRGQGRRGYSPPAGAEPTHIWDVSSCPDYPEGWSKYGIRARICQMRLSEQPRLAGVKHLNRLENVLAASEWDNNEPSDADVAEGLLMDAAGNFIEGTRTNLFLVSRGKLITPGLSRCGVAGVQRDRVIEWAAQHNVPLQVCDVGLDKVMNADELFVVNSIIGIWTIRELDQRCWMDFPVTSRIRDQLYGQDA